MLQHDRVLEIFPLKILRSLSQMSFLGIPSRPGATRPLFDLLERHTVPLKFLLEGCAGLAGRDLVICIPSKYFSDLEAELAEVKLRMQPKKVTLRQPVAIVRMLGPHFDIQVGTSGVLFSALMKAGVQVYSNATTITSSLCVIPEDQVGKAERAIARAFALPKSKK
ncbi:MAG: hypothetical protein JRI89_05030 [Deltaproteobacteria bacterium]|nr:hypothetical protein [Deltaproteobacteria bacterium]